MSCELDHPGSEELSLSFYLSFCLLEFSYLASLRLPNLKLLNLRKLSILQPQYHLQISVWLSILL